MRFYRIARADRHGTALAAFSGEGAAKFPGRWNHKGVRAVYCSDTLAGACLETLVHIRPSPRVFPPSVYYWIEVRDSRLEIPAVSSLPRNWNQAVVPVETRDFGSAFLRTRRAFGLVVPTAILPIGLNVVLNPVHPDFDLGAVSGPHPFFYDPRLE